MSCFEIQLAIFYRFGCQCFRKGYFSLTPNRIGRLYACFELFVPLTLTFRKFEALVIWPCFFVPLLLFFDTSALSIQASKA